MFILLFAAVAWTAQRSASHTVDEPLHAVGAWMHLTRHDFRINPEDPTLWMYWAALPNRSTALKTEFTSPLWHDAITNATRGWRWTRQVLYADGGPDPIVFVARSRAMMLVVAAGLGLVIAAVAWRAGGPVAGLIAVAFYALDPNFLGHGALVKNDVAMSLAWLALAYQIWLVGERASAARVIGLGVLAGVALCVKFSGVLAGPLIVVAMIVRLLLPQTWPVLGHVADTRLRRLAGAAAIVLVAALIAMTVMWATYGMRFNAAPAPAGRLNFTLLSRFAAENEYALKHPGSQITFDQAAKTKPSPLVRTINLLHDHRVLPEAWLYGFLYTYQSALQRPSLLLGRINSFGSMLYFPVTMAMKTPLATLTAAGLMVAVAVFGFARWAKVDRSVRSPIAWPLACLLLPVIVYGGSALRSHLDIGLRHIFPVYPFVFVSIGVAGAGAIGRWGRSAVVVSCVLIVGLAVESAVAFPHYIAFFNAAVGGPRRAMADIGDSNLDWGQDLPLLADWEKSHADKPMYIAYFGAADPRVYGVNAPDLHREHLDETQPWPTGPGVLAVSATLLQGTPLSPELRSKYATLLKSKPLAVLGGTIYLFELPLQRPN